jgi:hypothetical protein
MQLASMTEQTFMLNSFATCSLHSRSRQSLHTARQPILFALVWADHPLSRDCGRIIQVEKFRVLKTVVLSSTRKTTDWVLREWSNQCQGYCPFSTMYAKG